MSNKIGHSHRHTSLMQVEIISEPAPIVASPPMNLFGLARWLIQNAGGAKNEVFKMNFSCQYCYRGKREDRGTPVDEVSASTSTLEEQNSRYEQLPGAEDAKKQGKQKEFSNKFNFNGLRSHLSSK